MSLSRIIKLAGLARIDETETKAVSPENGERFWFFAFSCMKPRLLRKPFAVSLLLL